MEYDLSKLTQIPESAEDVVKYLREAIPPLVALLNELGEMQRTLSVAPPKPYEGMIRYADHTNWSPGAAAGLFRYTSGSWTAI